MGYAAKINIKALLIGILVDFGGSAVGGLLYGIVLALLLRMKGFSAGDIEQHLTDPQNAAFLTGGVFIGAVFTFLGAFTAARIAKTLAYLHAGIIGAIAILSGLLYIFLSQTAQAYPSWYNLAGLLLTLPAVLLGGYAAEKTGKKEEN